MHVATTDRYEKHTSKETDIRQKRHVKRDLCKLIDSKELAKERPSMWCALTRTDGYEKYVHIYTYTYIHMCIYIHIYIHLHIHIYIYICICMYIDVYTLTEIHIYIYIHIYVFKYISTHLPRLRVMRSWKRWRKRTRGLLSLLDLCDMTHSQSICNMTYRHHCMWLVRIICMCNVTHSHEFYVRRDGTSLADCCPCNV